MKKLAILFIAMSCLCATDLEKTFQDAFAIALNPEKANKFVDNAHALSDLWQLNNSYTFDILFNEEIEWNEKQQPQPGQGMLPGIAMLDPQQRGIFIYIGTGGFSFPQKHYALDLTSFQVVRFAEEETKNFRLIYPNNLPTNKIIMPHLTPIASGTKKGNKVDVELIADGSMYNLAFFSEGNMNLNIKTLNSKKKSQKFKKKIQDGRTAMIFNRNDGTLHLKATVKGESGSVLHLIGMIVLEH